VTLGVLVSEPALLDCYHDLELRAALLGRDPDLRYRERLLQAGQEGDALLAAYLASQRVQATFSELEDRLAIRETDLREARQSTEQTLLQLHQMQQEREHYVQSDSEKQRQLEAGVSELEELRQSKAAQASAYELEMESLRQRLEPQVAELEHRLATRDTELQDARQSSEQTLLQLHQMQQEREHFFQSDSEKQRQLEAGARELVELRQSKAAQASAYEQEIQTSRQRFDLHLAGLEQHLASKDTELQEARQSSEQTLLQLHQMQQEREHYVQSDSEKQRQLEAGVRELEELRQSKAALQSAHVEEMEFLRQRLERQVVELEQHLATRDI
jgi:chromosome segregation ATPase